MSSFDSTKVYLITLAGQGDIDTKIVNHETYEFVINGGELPEAQVEMNFELSQEFPDEEGDSTREEIRESFRNMTEGSSPDNDRALNIRADKFGPNGESFDGGSTAEMLKFLSRNGLKLSEDEYEGYIY